jgi:hypothetical protein
VEIPTGFAKTPWRRDPLQPRTVLDADGRTLFTAHKSGRVGDIGAALATADLLFLAPQMATEIVRLREALAEAEARVEAATEENRNEWERGYRQALEERPAR